MKTIGARLRKLRTEKGLTQQGLAARVSGGLDYTYIGKIERGTQSPSLKILEKIGEALDVPLAYFFLDEDATDTIPESVLAPLANEKAKRELIRALRQLHPEDISLATAIVAALNHHRQTAPAPAADADLQRAAEEETSYGKD